MIEHTGTTIDDVGHHRISMTNVKLRLICSTAQSNTVYGVDIFINHRLLSPKSILMTLA